MCLHVRVVNSDVDLLVLDLHVHVFGAILFDGLFWNGDDMCFTCSEYENFFGF